ncbi:anthranilate synthase component I family protein [Lunatibacter salilacus]|uniref:anthranilate synthase component I family protein n=1 Tax=Lunatibacter salilacus TaxID=2483804 RepID=UPI00131E296A|nr:anthranilate synthase component I family protein [Lunatibacter salilacus]
MTQQLSSGQFRIDQDWVLKLLHWTDNNYAYVAYFNSHGISYPYDGFRHQLFAAQSSISLSQASALPHRQRVGIVSYDQKNIYEKLASNNAAPIDCPESEFFIPEFQVIFDGDLATIIHPNARQIFNEIQNFELKVLSRTITNPTVHSLLTKDAYFKTFHKIQEHILEGDIYEMNYCMGFEGTFETLDAIGFYLRLCEKSPMPFSAFFKAKNKLVLGASPERFLKRAGNKLIAQPIKGSVKRGNTPAEDDALAAQLRSSEKEQAENLMIVDLMRNDLAKLAQPGKIVVEELFGIYQFRQITQMISTVSCEMKPNISLEQVFRQTFPMGSMTGAPKIKCMELIDHYENFKRGWFSGSIGYVDEQGDFDWNVIIRSVIVDREEKKFYFAVGSAITSDADAVQEYEECQLKAQAIFATLLD